MMSTIKFDKNDLTNSFTQPKMGTFQQVCLQPVTDLLSESRYLDAFAWLMTIC